MYIRRFLGKISESGEKIGDILKRLLFGEFFGRPIWERPTVNQLIFAGDLISLISLLGAHWPK